MQSSGGDGRGWYISAAVHASIPGKQAAFKADITSPSNWSGSLGNPRRPQYAPCGGPEDNSNTPHHLCPNFTIGAKWLRPVLTGRPC